MLVIAALQAIVAMAHHGPSSFIVEISAPNHAIRSKIATIIHPDYIADGRIYSIVNSDDLKVLQKELGKNILSVEIMGDEMPAYFASAAGIIDFPVGEEVYHTYDEMVAELRDQKKLSRPCDVVFFGQKFGRARALGDKNRAGIRGRSRKSGYRLHGHTPRT